MAAPKDSSVPSPNPLWTNSSPEDHRSWVMGEFSALRSEIDRRSTTQQAILGLQVTSALTLSGIAITHHPYASVLFLIGPSSLLLFLQWLDHRRTIRLVARYIRTSLEPHLVDSPQPSGGGSEQVPLGWQWYRYAHPDSTSHRFIWTVPMILLFSGVTAAALIGAWILIPTLNSPEWTFFGIDALIALVLLALLMQTSSHTKPVP